MFCVCKNAAVDDIRYRVGHVYLYLYSPTPPPFPQPQSSRVSKEQTLASAALAAEGYFRFCDSDMLMAALYLRRALARLAGSRLHQKNCLRVCVFVCVARLYTNLY